MTANEYRAALIRIGLTQISAARLLGVAPRTSRHYAAGETIPEAIARFLRVVEFVGLEQTRAILGITEPRPPRPRHPGQSNRSQAQTARQGRGGG